MQKVSSVERAGILTVTMIGVCIGLEIAFGPDIKLTPAVAALFPGLPVGVLVARRLGITAGLFACAVFNGAAYGIALFCWIRIATACARGLPIWLSSAGTRLSQIMTRR
jgi:hypothetical protein